MSAAVLYQHGGSDVELLLVLRDEDVRLNEVLDVFLFALTKNVRQPLELTLSTCHPHEVHLHTHMGVHRNGYIRINIPSFTRFYVPVQPNLTKLPPATGIDRPLT